jgi:hypothetical protein
MRLLEATAALLNALLEATEAPRYSQRVGPQPIRTETRGAQRGRASLKGAPLALRPWPVASPHPLDEGPCAVPPRRTPPPLRLPLLPCTRPVSRPQRPRRRGSQRLE